MKQVFLRDEEVAAKFSASMNRFGYKTATHFIGDMINFFEHNPVTPKEKFGGLLQDILNKMDDFNKDNNRVIAVVRKIENDKLNGIYRAVTQDIDYQLKEIKKCVYDEDKLYNNLNKREKVEEKESEKIVPKIEDKISNELVLKYEQQIKKEVDAYKLLEEEYDEKTKQLGNIYNKLKKLSKLYLVEKGTFSKPKIVIEMTEEEFLELIKL